MEVTKTGRGRYLITTPKYIVPLSVYRDYFGLWVVSQGAGAPSFAGPFKTAKQAIQAVKDHFAE